MIIRLFAAALTLAAASPSSAEEASDYDWFELWNECLPIRNICSVGE